MATEPLQAAPYAVGTDAPDGPAQLLALASWARLKVVQVYASAAARTAAFSAAGVSPTEGMISWLQDVDRFDKFVLSAWVPLTGRLGRLALTADILSTAGAEQVGVSGSAQAMAVPLISGRRYRVTANGLINVAVSTDLVKVRARYSTGTVTTGSTSAENPAQIRPGAAGGPGQSSVQMVAELTAPTTNTYNVALTVANASGSGNSSLLAGAVWEVLDITD